MPANIPFLPEPKAYAEWRQARLDRFHSQVNAGEIIELETDLGNGSTAIQGLRARCAEQGFARYRLRRAAADGRQWLIQLAAALGLRQIDRHLCTDPSGISRIEVRDTDTQAEYIPYTTRALSWHTDGYYHPPAQQLGAWLLHCERPAAKGGNNEVLNPELLYIALRDADASAAAALFHPDTLSIPANREEGGAARPASTGPVFWVEKHSGRLHCRYSARKRHIHWREHPDTARARDLIDAQLGGDNPYIERFRLQPNEGIVSNNALHNRSAFTDASDPAQTRRLFRGRFYDTVLPG